MPAMTITLPDDLQRIAQQRASSVGFDSVVEYIGALIRADASEPLSAELESHILTALQTPTIEVTPAFWQDKKQRLAERHGEKRQ